MLEKWYKAIYSRIGGQPFTYIIRDSYRKYPLLWIFGICGVGVVLGHIFWGG